MDKKDFISAVRNAEKSRKCGKLPSFSKSDVVSSTQSAGTPKEAFVRNFKNNHGNVIESVAELVEILKSKGCKRGVADAKMADTFGLEKHFELVREFDRNAPESYDFSISRATYGIGESGALVLKDSDTADRMATIAPWVHVAVLKESDILADIPDALAKTVDCPYAIWVAGPSKTTDVEGVLVEGVHGPGIQICLVVRG